MLNFLKEVAASLLNSPAKKLAWIVGIDDSRVDGIYIDLKNSAQEQKFRAVPKSRRILLLPHCLRDQKGCVAKKTWYGLECVECGRCVISRISKRARKLGYGGVFVLPGGSVVPKILRKHKPLAVLGVACNKELVLGVMATEKIGIPAQGVMLLKSGCVNTDVDVEEVFEKMEL